FLIIRRPPIYTILASWSGSVVYKLRLYLTEINIRRPDADTFFPLPPLPPCDSEWRHDDRSGMDFRFRDILL
ncbi:MAG: hypothetical protein K2H03_05785, partial [Muribaculaceae bacterium]|nr:hypothetical protein [Muribaculaceae bacterium]